MKIDCCDKNNIKTLWYHSNNLGWNKVNQNYTIEQQVEIAKYCKDRWKNICYAIEYKTNRKLF